MPITSNGFYNDAAIGNSFQNIASMFAPPTLQDQVLAQTIAQQKATAQARADALNRVQADHPRVKNLSDLFTAGSKDPVADAGKLAQYDVAASNPSNLGAQDAFNYANGGDFSKTVAAEQMKPVSEGQTQFLPGSVTGGAPVTRYGVLKNGDRTTLLPNGQVPAAGGAPAAGDDGTAAIIQGLGPGVVRAPSGVVSVDAPDKPDTVDSQLAAYFGNNPDKLAAYAAAKSQPDKGITINNGAEKAEEQGRGAGLSKRLNEVVEEGNTAAEDQAVFSRFGDLLSNVNTGAKTAALERFRQATGIAIDPNADNVQALNAAIQYVAPRLRVKGSGAQSDRELGNFLASVPSLAGTPGGNAQILDTLRGIASLKQQRASVAQAWQEGRITSQDADQQLAALPSPFASTRASQPAAASPYGAAPTFNTGAASAPQPAALAVGQSSNLNGAVVRRVR